MNRREALKRTAIIMGGALSAPLVSAVLQGCQADMAAADWMPAFLTADEAAAVGAMAETILPHTDDLPGALDVGVDRFIDTMLAKYDSEEDRQNFRTGLQLLDAHCQEKTGKAFTKLTGEELLTYLHEVNQEAATQPQRQRKDPDHLAFFMNLKQRVLAGYFTSQKVGTEVLAYDPIPGECLGCAPLEELTGGRAWSLV